jgi:hypothetical protein
VIDIMAKLEKHSGGKDKGKSKAQGKATAPGQIKPAGESAIGKGKDKQK